MASTGHPGLPRAGWMDSSAWAASPASPASPTPGTFVKGGKSNIKVSVRVRPPERAWDDAAATVAIDPPARQITAPASADRPQRTFSFDDVHSQGAAQADVYRSLAAPLVDHFLDGYNVTIMAYGQTGSGKTYTIGSADQEGEEEGIVQRVLGAVFEAQIGQRSSAEYEFRVQFLEIHNEMLRDLLNPVKDGRGISLLDVNGAIHINGARQELALTHKAAARMFRKGCDNRAIGATAQNGRSSRSHAIFTLVMYKRLKADPATTYVAKLHLVDLAGSERNKKAQTSGARFKEGISINHGLLALGKVINALSHPARHSPYVPYRDSKLTRILQDSLGGNSHTAIVACVSADPLDLEETLRTLQYANDARNIRLHPTQVRKMAAGGDAAAAQAQVWRLMDKAAGGGPNKRNVAVSLLRRLDEETVWHLLVAARQHATLPPGLAALEGDLLERDQDLDEDDDFSHPAPTTPSVDATELQLEVDACRDALCTTLHAIHGRSLQSHFPQDLLDRLSLLAFGASATHSPLNHTPPRAASPLRSPSALTASPFPDSPPVFPPFAATPRTLVASPLHPSTPPLTPPSDPSSAAKPHHPPASPFPLPASTPFHPHLDSFALQLFPPVPRHPASDSTPTTTPLPTLVVPPATNRLTTDAETQTSPQVSDIVIYNNTNILSQYSALDSVHLPAHQDSDPQLPTLQAPVPTLSAALRSALPSRASGTHVSASPLPSLDTPPSPSNTAPLSFPHPPASAGPHLLSPLQSTNQPHAAAAPGAALPPWRPPATPLDSLVHSANPLGMVPSSVCSNTLPDHLTTHGTAHPAGPLLNISLHPDGCSITLDGIAAGPGGSPMLSPAEAQRLSESIASVQELLHQLTHQLITIETAYSAVIGPGAGAYTAEAAAAAAARRAVGAPPATELSDRQAKLTGGSSSVASAPSASGAAAAAAAVGSAFRAEARWVFCGSAARVDPVTGAPLGSGAAAAADGGGAGGGKAALDTTTSSSTTSVLHTVTADEVLDDGVGGERDSPRDGTGSAAGADADSNGTPAARLSPSKSSGPAAAAAAADGAGGAVAEAAADPSVDGGAHAGRIEAGGHDWNLINVLKHLIPLGTRPAGEESPVDRMQAKSSGSSSLDLLPPPRQPMPILSVGLSDHAADDRAAKAAEFTDSIESLTPLVAMESGTPPSASWTPLAGSPAPARLAYQPSPLPATHLAAAAPYPPPLPAASAPSPADPPPALQPQGDPSTPRRRSNTPARATEVSARRRPTSADPSAAPPPLHGPYSPSTGRATLPPLPPRRSRSFEDLTPPRRTPSAPLRRPPSKSPPKVLALHGRDPRRLTLDRAEKLECISSGELTPETSTALSLASNLVAAARSHSTSTLRSARRRLLQTASSQEQLIYASAPSAARLATSTLRAHSATASSTSATALVRRANSAAFPSTSATSSRSSTSAARAAAARHNAHLAAAQMLQLQRRQRLRQAAAAGSASAPLAASAGGAAGAPAVAALLPAAAAAAAAPASPARVLGRAGTAPPRLAAAEAKQKAAARRAEGVVPARPSSRAAALRTGSLSVHSGGQSSPALAGDGAAAAAAAAAATAALQTPPLPSLAPVKQSVSMLPKRKKMCFCFPSAAVAGATMSQEVPPLAEQLAAGGPTPAGAAG